MKQLRIHYFQHVNFEGLGSIGPWIKKNGHQLSCTRFFMDEPLPEVEDIDWLIVMGGPMGVHDEAIYPWLAYEKVFIKKAINSDKTVIGICLGAQLIANALGAKVYPNPYKEIGWFDVSMKGEGLESTLIKGLEEKMKVFHWHGDTFDLPAGSLHLFESEACSNQAFLYNSKVLGLQFHFEVDEESLNEMIFNGKHELLEDKFVQAHGDILKDISLISKNNALMSSILGKLASQ
jgi:GMP synthase-like glutamine amidotransferase